jgi:hypothetical protein
MEELDHLATLEVEHKAIFVYSDLKEHSPDGGLNLYIAKTLDELFKSPNDIRKIIEDQVQIPEDLKGIEVHFVYQSELVEEVRTFEAMASILKGLLEDKGASVFILSHFKTK